jgi:hypothetical protein
MLNRVIGSGGARPATGAAERAAAGTKATKATKGTQGTHPTICLPPLAHSKSEIGDFTRKNARAG